MKKEEKIKKFQYEIIGTNLKIWRYVIQHRFGVEFSGNHNNAWCGVMMDWIYSMVLDEKNPGSKKGRDFKNFENKTSGYKKTGKKSLHDYILKGDLFISKYTTDKLSNKTFDESNLKDKIDFIQNCIDNDFNLIDFRRFDTRFLKYIEDDYNFLMSLSEDELKNNPSSRRGDYIALKYYNKGNHNLNIKAGVIYDITNSMLPINHKKHIKNNKQLNIINQIIDRWFPPMLSYSGDKFITPSYYNRNSIGRDKEKLTIEERKYSGHKSLKKFRVA